MHDGTRVRVTQSVQSWRRGQWKHDSQSLCRSYQGKTSDQSNRCDTRHMAKAGRWRTLALGFRRRRGCAVSAVSLSMQNHMITGSYGM